MLQVEAVEIVLSVMMLEITLLFPSTVTSVWQFVLLVHILKQNVSTLQRRGFFWMRTNDVFGRQYDG